MFKFNPFSVFLCCVSFRFLPILCHFCKHRNATECSDWTKPSTTLARHHLLCDFIVFIFRLIVSILSSVIVRGKTQHIYLSFALRVFFTSPSPPPPQLYRYLLVSFSLSWKIMTYVLLSNYIRCMGFSLFSGRQIW